MVRVTSQVNNHLSLPETEEAGTRDSVLKLRKSWANGDGLVTMVTTRVCTRTSLKKDPILHLQTQKCQDPEKF